MTSPVADGIFKLIPDEQLLHLAAIYDKNFDPDEKSPEVAKESLHSTQAFKHLVWVFDEIVKKKQNGSMTDLFSVLATELLDLVHDDKELKRKKEMFGEAFDAFVHPVVYEYQEYHVTFQLQDCQMVTSIYHEYATRLHDIEIFEEARSIVLGDLHDLLGFNMSFQEFEAKHKDMLSDVDFTVTRRDMKEEDTK